MLISAPDAVREKYRGLTTVDRGDRPLPPRHPVPTMGGLAAHRGQNVGPAGAVPRRPSRRAASPDRRSGQRSQSRAAGGPWCGRRTAAQLLITAEPTTRCAGACAGCTRIPRPRADHQTPTLPRRDRCQQRSASHRLGAPGPPPTDQGLRPTSTAQGHSKGEILQTQARHRPRDLQTADPPDRHAEYADLRQARQARTSPSPQPPNTSGPGPPRSPASKPADNATTPSQTPTEPGSPPLDQ